MCRRIKTLFNFEPPASELAIRDASLQFIRKLSGFSVPTRANARQRAPTRLPLNVQLKRRSLRRQGLDHPGGKG